MERVLGADVLITNLFSVAIDTGFGCVYTHTNALILSDRGPENTTLGARYRMHGFHNEAANPTFDLVMPSFNWKIEPQSHKRSFILSFVDAAGPKILLTTDYANDVPLDIERLDRTARWSDLLVRKVLRYYYDPYFILGQPFDADRARQTLGVECASEGTSC